MTGPRFALWVGVLLFPVDLFLLSIPLPAQPRVELSPAQAQLRAAIDNLDAGGIREALRAGADPNHRYGGRGRSVIAAAGTNVLLGRDE